MPAKSAAAGHSKDRPRQLAIEEGGEHIVNRSANKADNLQPG